MTPMAAEYWNREKDNIGIGYAHLSRGNQEIDNSRVFETYYRLAFSGILSATANVQHLNDDFFEGGDRKGWFLGVSSLRNSKQPRSTSINKVGAP